MKNKLTALCAALVFASVSWLSAADAPAHAPTPKPASKEFEKLKTLVGTWQGKTDMGQGPIDITVQTRLIAGGTVLEERVFAGTPNEMVTMYYDKDGKLALTHYCVMGNQPVMKLKSFDGKSISFDLDASCCTIDKKESHMHAMTMRFDDADTITTSCKALINGQEAPECATVFKRVKTVAAK